MEAAKKRAQQLRPKRVRGSASRSCYESIPMADHEQSRREECALGPDHRCLVSFASFAEYGTIDGKKVPMWFVRNVGRRLSEDQKLLNPRQVLRSAGFLPHMILNRRQQRRAGFPFCRHRLNQRECNYGESFAQIQGCHGCCSPIIYCSSIGGTPPDERKTSCYGLE
jgi:hypothetical protein